MLDHKDFDIEKLNLFWWFVFERQNIWYKRFVQKVKFPWTKDYIMQNERFTNVYRELDPGTQYAINKILEIDAPKPDKIFNIMIYRLIGRSETHAAIGFQELSKFNPKILKSKLKYIRDVENKKVFTAAYMVGGYSKMGSKDKIVNITRLFTNLHNIFYSIYEKINACKSSEEVYKVICSLYGFGNFLSYQILVDLLYPLKIYNYRGLLPYSNNDWASAGPGAKRGIIMLLKRGVKANYLEVMRWLNENQHNEFERLNSKFCYIKDFNGSQLDISLANIQNCLCEFHKYIKISNGTGRGRRKFFPLVSSLLLQLLF